MPWEFFACAVRNCREQSERDVRAILDYSHPRSAQTIARSGNACFGVGTSGPPTAVRTLEERGRLFVATGDGLQLDPLLELGWLTDVAGCGAGDSGYYSRRFAAVGWDEPSRTVSLARDPLGMEPIYYATLPYGGFAAASRALALLRLADVPRELDPESAAAALIDVARRPGATFLRHVAELPRATMIQWNVNGTTLRRYTSLSALRSAPGAPRRDVQMRHALENCVKQVLHGAERPGVMLSGGLDSTSVFRCARAVVGERVTSITAEFPEDPKSYEGEYLACALRDTACLSVKVVPSDVVSIDACLEAADDPLWVPRCSIVLACASRAELLGIDCILTGEFGDFIGGAMSNPLAWLLVRRRWRRALAVSSQIGGRSWRQLARLMSQWLALNVRSVQQWRLRKLYSFNNDVAWLGSLSADVRKRYDLEQRLRGEWSAEVAPVSSPAEEAERFFDFATPLVCGASWLGERLTGVHIEHPFAAPALARLATDLEFEDRWTNGLTRIALRKAMDGVVPPQILGRTTKASFSAAHGAWGERIRLLGQNKRELWPLNELIEFRLPKGGPEGAAERAAFEYTLTRARTMAAWLRMVLAGSASKDS